MQLAHTTGIKTRTKIGNSNDLDGGNGGRSFLTR
jgi:hypothetical protein